MPHIKTLLGLAVVATLAGILFVWFGVFNIAANDKHWAVTTLLLEIVRDRSISTRAEDIVVPDITDKARIKRGAANYASMCAMCHLAPGKDTSELHAGMYPTPPVLYKKLVFDRKLSETFWIIKNGIKATGMPAWGENNSDEQIWDMIALISALHKMTPEQYKKHVDSGKHTHKDDMPDIRNETTL